jgi:site-specific recombinase XerD
MQPSRAPEAPKQAIDPATKQISSAPEIAETVQLPLALPPVVMPTPPAERQSPSEVHHLSTFELIRPQERLKQSIEGFLLDQRSEHTRRAYGRDLKRFLMFLSARNFQQGPSELNRTVLIAYKESLLTEKLEHTTVDRHLATLKSFFNWLVDDGILLRSPAHGVRFLSPKRLSKTIGFSDEEVKKVLAMPNLHTRTGSLHYAVLMVLFYCGLRRSEACSLRTTHFGTEREQRVLRLMGKGNKERIIVVIPAVWSALVHYFRITRREFSEPQALFMPIRNNRTQEVKKAIDPSMVFYIVTKYAKLAGIANRVSPHSCRATAISNARDHHVPDRAIQEFAGWASPDMITRYDKRRSSIEDSAAHAISYGAEARILPESSEPS